MRVRHICICVKIFHIFNSCPARLCFSQRLRPCLRISQSRLQPFPQPFLKFCRFVVQRRSSLLKEFNLPAFTAEHNGIHTDRRQKRDSIGGKFMRRGGRKSDRHLKYQVGTGEKSGFCTTVLIKDGGFAALDEAAAHQDDTVVRAGQFPCLLHMIQMSGMERVIFGN